MWWLMSIIPAMWETLGRKTLVWGWPEAKNLKCYLKITKAKKVAPVTEQLLSKLAEFKPNYYQTKPNQTHLCENKSESFAQPTRQTWSEYAIHIQLQQLITRGQFLLTMTKSSQRKGQASNLVRLIHSTGLKIKSSSLLMQWISTGVLVSTLRTLWKEISIWMLYPSTLLGLTTMCSQGHCTRDR
jgi:hypothetical protein